MVLLPLDTHRDIDRRLSEVIAAVSSLGDELAYTIGKLRTQRVRKAVHNLGNVRTSLDYLCQHTYGVPASPTAAA